MFCVSTRASSQSKGDYFVFTLIQYNMKIEDLDIDGLDIFKGKRKTGYILRIPTLPPIIMVQWEIYGCVSNMNFLSFI